MTTKALLLVFFMLVATPFMAIADETDALKKKIVLDQKRLVIMENMEFSENEAKGFWPLYDKYQEELFLVNQRAAKLIVAYASVYQTLADDQALKIVDEHFGIRSDRQKIMQEFAGDLKKILSGKRVFRYLQVENKIEAIARFELARGIPLAQ